MDLCSKNISHPIFGARCRHGLAYTQIGGIKIISKYCGGGLKWTGETFPGLNEGESIIACIKCGERWHPLSLPALKSLKNDGI